MQPLRRGPQGRTHRQRTTQGRTQYVPHLALTRESHVSETWHVISERDLLAMLRRCEDGESAPLVYAEVYANAVDREQIDGD